MVPLLEVRGEECIRHYYHCDAATVRLALVEAVAA